MKTLAFFVVLTLVSRLSLAAEPPIRIGELNSYAAQPSFLIPYRNGWKLALQEINDSGGLLGRRVMPSDANVRAWRKTD